ncbi:MFS transporter [Inquilinus sp. OTU3971]|uniref:MFS transporter n=1 Tax=Inquilinus sp. OTU3971 TaxID=3043855 RepID=UPI00313DD7E4
MSQTPPAKAAPARLATRYWTLAILALVAFLAMVDRQAFSVLLVPMQRDLGVSDGKMGFLSGSAFALAQAIFTLPLAWLADRTSRRDLLVVAVIVWSLATAVGGLAGGFATLLLARLVVGAAEAAQTPATVSLVADLFERNQRGAAFMACSVGAALGVSFGAYVGGALSERQGWQGALQTVGLPGLLVAAILRMTVTEPPRPARVERSELGDLRAAASQLKQSLAIPTLPPFLAGYVALQAASMGWYIWFPAFLMRVHGLSAAQMGAVFGTVVLCGMLAAMWGGPVSDLLAKRGARWRLYFIVAIIGLSIPFLCLSFLAPSLILAQICAMGFTLFLGAHHPVAMATYASLSPPASRAFVSGLVFVSGALLGAAAAPLLFGVVNDLLAPSLGARGLRYTLLLAPALLAVAAVFYAIASRTADGDTLAAERPTVVSA